MGMYFETVRSDALYPSHDFPRNWSAVDLADAMPLRLSERMSLGLVEFIATPGAANNPFVISPKRDGFRRNYVAGAELTSFRVR
ncbi:hypothetical protein [Lysobacter sp. Root494]|uniref:hypothetical protein n=1 Tax=Lysobacter sp. Root494 TaxID=1736549 RepID=UPI000B0E6B8E|nr:hypothetical protein [Lysobacter sp. Root494]